MSTLFVYAFAAWTLACHAAVAAGWSFRTLTFLGPVAIAAGVGAWIAWGRTAAPGPASGAPPGFGPIPPSLSAKTPWPWLAAALGISAAYAASGDYRVFWALAILYMAGLLVVLRRGWADSPPAPCPWTRAECLTLAALSVAAVLVVLAVHRPDADDAFFLAIPADALTHPGRAVLGHDPMYDDGPLPLLLPSYRVASLELLSGQLATLWGGAPVFWAHTILPALLASLLAPAWARMLRHVTRHRLIATATVLALMLLVGETHIALGNFAFVRLFQGKAALACLGVPLLYAAAWDYAAAGTARTWIALALAIVAALGLSSSALIVAPLALGMALASAHAPGRTRRLLLGLIPVLYPLAWGLALHGGTDRSIQDLASPSFDTNAVASLVLGPHGQYPLLLGLLATGLFSPSPRQRWRLALLAAGAFALPLDPFFLILLKISPSLAAIDWRLTWTIPLLGLIAAGFGDFCGWMWTRWRWRGAVAIAGVVAATLAVLAPYWTLRPASNHLFLAWGGPTAPPLSWALAREATATTPPGTALLAPEDIAVWIPAQIGHPPLVTVRDFYIRLLRRAMGPGEARDRQILGALVSPGPDPTPDATADLAAALSRRRVGLIVVADSLYHARAATFSALGFTEGTAQTGYRLLRRP